MAKKETLSENAVLTTNAKAMKRWIKSNSSLVKPKANKAIFYTGNSIRLLTKKVEKELQIEQRIKIAASPEEKRALQREKKELQAGFFKVVKGAQAAVARLKLPMEFDDIDAVLKRIKKHPPFIDRDQNQIEFSDMYDYAHSVGTIPKLFPKKEIKFMWSELSEAFAKNAEGDIRVLEGVEDDFRTAGGTKDFVKRELPTLIKSRKLSDDSQKTLQRIVGKYMRTYKGETKRMVKDALSEARKLKKPT